MWTTKVRVYQSYWKEWASISRDSLDVYLKAVKRLGLYICTTYKNGSDVQMCLYEEKLILLEAPILPENPTAHQQ